MSQQEKKIALAMDAQNLLDTEMHEIKGGYDNMQVWKRLFC